MHPCNELISPGFDCMENIYHTWFENEILDQDWFEICATEILDARYQCTGMKDMDAKQHHLNDTQKADLFAVLHENENLFDESQ